MLNEVILNLYAQDGISRQRITKYFEILDENEKIKFLDKLLFLTQSSNAHGKQLEEALENSGYRNTINYYNMLKSKKNIFRNNLFRLKELDGKPFEQGFDLLLELFKEAYKCKALYLYASLNNSSSKSKPCLKGFPVSSFNLNKLFLKIFFLLFNIL